MWLVGTQPWLNSLRNIRKSSKFIAFASSAGGLRTCFVAAFDSFKKYATHFLNPAFGGTESKEAPTQVLVEILRGGYPTGLEIFSGVMEAILKIYSIQTL